MCHSSSVRCAGDRLSLVVCIGRSVVVFRANMCRWDVSELGGVQLICGRLLAWLYGVVMVWCWMRRHAWWLWIWKDMGDSDAVCARCCGERRLTGESGT